MASDGGRTWRTWQLLVTASIALVVGIAAGAGTGDKDQTVSANAGQVTTTQATLSQVTSAPTTPPTPPPTLAATTTAPTTTTTAAKTWVVVTTLSGTSEKRGDNFRLDGGSTQARLRYKSSAGVFGVYVVKAGDSLERSGGFTEASCSEACGDETRLVKSAGEYYLDVSVSRGSWSVTIEEFR